MTEIDPVKFFEVTRAVDTIIRSPSPISIEDRVKDIYGEDPTLYGWALDYLDECRSTSPSRSDAPANGELPPFMTWSIKRGNSLLDGEIKITAPRPMRVSGGSSELWRAETKHRKKLVVLKFIIGDKLADATIAAALALQEVQSLTPFTHKNVVRVYDGGTLVDDNGSEHPFVLMEHICGATKDQPGCTLQEWREHRLSLSTKECAKVAIPIANGLHALHSFEDTPILHLDVKPENVMVQGGVESDANEKTLKIIDLGSLVATLPYMAPERFTKGAKAAVGWDVFSFGGLLYFLATGQRPRSARGVSEQEWKEWLSQLKFDHADFARIVRKCLAYDPTQRFASMKEAEKALTAFVHDYPIPHIDRPYSWLERELLLVRRCRMTACLSSHCELLIRLAVILALVALGRSIGYHWGMASGQTPAEAFHTAGFRASICGGAILAGFWGLVRGRMTGLLMLEPLAAYMAATFVIFRFLSPGVAGDLSRWEDVVTGCQYAILLHGVLDVVLAASTEKWNFLRYIGWTEIVVAVFLRQLFAHPNVSPFVPDLWTVDDMLGCAVFAFYIRQRGLKENAADRQSIEPSNGERIVAPC